LFELFGIDEDVFETLAARICVDILGTGTVVFAKGKDGGRDGAFEGTANNFPSASKPAKGKFVIQAKHTAAPYASTKDSTFTTLWKKELPKIASLVQQNECDVYLLFTNRRCPAAHKKQLKAELKSQGVKQCEIYCLQTIDLHLGSNQPLVKSVGLDKYKPPFRIQPDDLSQVIQDFHLIYSAPGTGDSLHDLRYLALEDKNRINLLSKTYYDYMQSSSMPYFSQIREFLENPRNSSLREQYHATADEIKGKLLTFQSLFTGFEEAFALLYDMLIDQNATLKAKRRLVNVFLHYMYCDCDIGKKNA